MNGIAPLGAAAAAADKSQAVVDDLQLLATSLAPVAGNSQIAIVGSPDVVVGLALRMPHRVDWPILMTTALAPKTVVAVAVNAVASAIDGAPQVDARQDPVFHMADPASPTIDGVTPVGSTFQTDSVGLRLRWPISWALRDPRGVAWISGVNW